MTLGQHFSRFLVKCAGRRPIRGKRLSTARSAGAVESSVRECAVEVLFKKWTRQMSPQLPPSPLNSCPTCKRGFPPRPRQPRPLTPEETARLLSTLERCRESKPPLPLRLLNTWQLRQLDAAASAARTNPPGAHGFPWRKWATAPYRYLLWRRTVPFLLRLSSKFLRPLTVNWLKRALNSRRRSPTTPLQP